jgi:hypothetical protein
MHAALILLDICFALGTWFGVYFQPVCGVLLVVSSYSVQPSQQQLARDWGVGHLQAAETEVLSTLAKTVNWLLFLYLNDHVATSAWTPLVKL